MEGNALTVGEVADLIGVSTNTIRRLAGSLAPHLSEGSRSRPRVFTHDDIERLRVASRLKASQVANPGTVEEIVLPSGMPGLAAAQPPMVDELQRRLDALERAHSGQQLIVYLNGMAAGVALCLFLLVLAYLLVNGAAL